MTSRVYWHDHKLDHASAVDEFERVVASEDIMYTKTHGHQLLVNNLYAEEKTAIHANSFLHGLKYL